MQAIQDRNGMDMLTALVDSGANINLPAPDGSYPIHAAVATGRHETVLFLLNRAASVKKHRNVHTHTLQNLCSDIHVHVCMDILLLMYSAGWKDATPHCMLAEGF